MTGTETALLAAAQASGTDRDSACGLRAARRRAVCVPRGHGGARARRRLVHDQHHAAGPLRGAVAHLRGDYIEAGSWAVVAAVTGGDIEVTGADPRDLEPIAAVLALMGVSMQLDQNALVVRPSSLVAARRITTGLWPGFPSDIVSLITVLATQARGRTLLHDWMYELRLFALEQLSSMRADLFLCDPHRIIVTGPTKLRGRCSTAATFDRGWRSSRRPWPRKGRAPCSKIETVERGYAELLDRLQSLGAQVERRD